MSFSVSGKGPDSCSSMSAGGPSAASGFSAAAAMAQPARRAPALFGQAASKLPSEPPGRRWRAVGTAPPAHNQSGATKC